MALEAQIKRIKDNPQKDYYKNRFPLEFYFYRWRV